MLIVVTPGWLRFTRGELKQSYRPERRSPSSSAHGPTVARNVFFSLTSWELWLLVFVVLFAASGTGVVAGRALRGHSDTHREPIGAIQGALLGVVGLMLAFGLSLAVGRYQDRRADVVADANAIGTTYLRAQTIPEPQRTARSPFCESTTTSRSRSPTRFRAARRSVTPPTRQGGSSAPSGASLPRPSTLVPTRARHGCTSTA